MYYYVSYIICPVMIVILTGIGSLAGVGGLVECELATEIELFF